MVTALWRKVKGIYYVDLRKTTYLSLDVLVVFGSGFPSPRYSGQFSI